MARGGFYPPAAAALGIELDNLVVVHPTRPADYDWAWSQSLHCSAVAAVVGWPEKLDSREFRRWQLAAETSGSLGLLVRSSRAAGEPHWADVRLLVQSLSTAAERRMKVELLRCRGRQASRSVELELDDETHTLHLAAELAPATPVRRSTGT